MIREIVENLTSQLCAILAITKPTITDYIGIGTSGSKSNAKQSPFDLFSILWYIEIVVLYGARVDIAAVRHRLMPEAGAGYKR